MSIGTVNHLIGRFSARLCQPQHRNKRYFHLGFRFSNPQHYPLYCGWTLLLRGRGNRSNTESRGKYCAGMARPGLNELRRDPRRPGTSSQSRTGTAGDRRLHDELGNSCAAKARQRRPARRKTDGRCRSSRPPPWIGRQHRGDEWTPRNPNHCPFRALYNRLEAGILVIFISFSLCVRSSRGRNWV
jgi:hypothetical protein